MCTPNRTHGTPLAFPSCNPPVQTSTSLTIGSPDANGAAANSVGFIKISVIAGAPGLPEDSDVALNPSITDIRCKAGVAACGAANAADGADYTGEVQANAQIRITDHWNAVAPGGGPERGDRDRHPVPRERTLHGEWQHCHRQHVRGDHHGERGLEPGRGDPAVKDTKRAIVEISQLQVTDGGTDGVVATTPNTLFEVQGIFIP